jgi:hypothetical protein
METLIMEYNTQYLDIKYALINAFLIDADKTLLDISYDIENEKIQIQIILLAGSDWSSTIKEKATHWLGNWQYEMNILFITKENFNENIGDWSPKYYKWLKYLLFSKAKVV